MNNNISEMLTSSLEKIHNMVDVNTIIGKPMTVGDGVTIIPIAAKKDPFGGGMGAGVNIDPVAFLVIRGESVRMLPVAEPASTTIDRIVEQGPDLLDKLADFLDGRKAKEEA